MRSFLNVLLLGLISISGVRMGCAQGVKKDEEAKPSPKVCIAHRGASAYAPEHTIAAYKLAMKMNADFVEPDLQTTKDGELICMHDNTLERTTNVAQIYPGRAYQADARGQNKKTWRVVDFTLTEIRKLDAGNWFDAAFAGERVPTFQEMIDVVKTKPGTGIYPEIKNPEYHRGVGIDMETLVAKVLKDNGLDTPEGQSKTPVYIQSFSPDALRRMAKLTGKTYKLVQLVDGRQARQLMSDVGLVDVATYAQGIGPAIQILSLDKTRVEAAHKLGLAIHPYTVDGGKIPAPWPDGMTYTHHLLFEVGVDGVFTNNPDQFPRK